MEITLIIKQLKRIRRFLIRHKNILINRLNREPNLLFHSHNVGLAEAIRKHVIKKTNQIQPIILKVEPHLNDGISIHENVIAVPLINTEKPGFFEGGLISSINHELIKEAIHFGYGYPKQDLSSFNSQDIFLKDVSEIENPVFFGGILFDHFGCFLLESIGRLWAYKYFKELNPFICFFTPWGIPNYLGRDNYVNQVLTGFDIPHKKLIFLNQLVRFKKVIVPDQKYGTLNEYAKNTDPSFQNFVKNFKFNNNIPQGFENADKIYVSRSKLPIDAGRVIGESLFEEYLISNGYKILYPERYSLFQQLTIYNSAKKIIFCSGSSIHTCILLPDLKADVAIIARAKWQCPNDNLFLMQQFQGYGKSVLGIDTLRGQYQFEDFESNFEHALSDVDWYKASILLEKQGFVNSSFNSFEQLDYSSLVRYELQDYIRAISENPRFIDFMINLKE